jgi:hypothetical protein
VEKCYGRPSKLVHHLRTFGEMAISTKKSKIQGTLVNKGIPVMFVGYADEHAPDVYRLLKISNTRILLSRDVRWLKKMYGSWQSGDGINDEDAPEEGATLEQLEAENEPEESKPVTNTAVHEDDEPVDSALSQAVVDKRTQGIPQDDGTWSLEENAQMRYSSRKTLREMQVDIRD